MAVVRMERQLLILAMVVVECKTNAVEQMVPDDDLLPVNTLYMAETLDFVVNVPMIVHFSYEIYVVYQKPDVLEMMAFSFSLPTPSLWP